MRHQIKSNGASALAAALLVFAALTSEPSNAAPAAVNSAGVFNFSEASQRQNAGQATENHTGQAPVPEPSTWISMAGLLGICAGLAVSARTNKPRG